MMVNLSKPFCIIIIICLMYSCKFDNLYYSNSNTAKIKLNIDWHETSINPNGISTYIFDHVSGNMIGNVIISHDPKFVNLNLPEGLYDILVINDTEDELEYICFKDIDHLSDFTAMIHTFDNDNSLSSPLQPTNQYALGCNKVAYGILHKLQVDKQEIEYYKNIPSKNQYTALKQFNIKLNQITELLDIEITITNINSAARAPECYITNMASGYNFYSDEKAYDLITRKFTLNNRTIDSKNTKIGKISNQLISFGPHHDTSHDTCTLINQHRLIMNFPLTNNRSHQIEIQLNNIMDITHNGIKYINKIRAAIELPESIGNGEGVFNPDIGDWDDIEIGCPI